MHRAFTQVPAVAVGLVHVQKDSTTGYSQPISWHGGVLQNFELARHLHRCFDTTCCISCLRRPGQRGLQHQQIA